MNLSYRLRDTSREWPLTSFLAIRGMEMMECTSAPNYIMRPHIPNSPMIRYSLFSSFRFDALSSGLSTDYFLLPIKIWYRMPNYYSICGSAWCKELEVHGDIRWRWRFWRSNITIYILTWIQQEANALCSRRSRLWLMIMLVGLGDATLREIRSSGCISAPSEFNVWETHKHRIRVIRARETSELQAMVCDRFLVWCDVLYCCVINNI